MRAQILVLFLASIALSACKTSRGVGNARLSADATDDGKVETFDADEWASGRGGGNASELGCVCEPDPNGLWRLFRYHLSDSKLQRVALATTESIEECVRAKFASSTVVAAEPSTGEQDVEVASPPRQRVCSLAF